MNTLRFYLFSHFLILSLIQSIYSNAQELYPLNDYKEPRIEGEAPNSAEWDKLNDNLYFTWTNRNDLTSLYAVPQINQQNHMELYAWRGEKINAKALLYAKNNQGSLTLRFSAWNENNEKTIIPNEVRFLNYVITDDYKACGNHNFSLKPWLVPDIIDQDKPHNVPAKEVRPIWFSLDIPYTIPSGKYTAKLDILNTEQKIINSLSLTLHINQRKLPTPQQQSFHLDLWQQPYAVSRYYNVSRWSDAHFEALKPYLKALARAGQKVVSTILFYEPWGVQSHDKFDPMIQVTKNKNGTWNYDYTIFDRYVNLCDSCGINKQINCFSMIPWDMNFRYYDESLQKFIDLKTTPDQANYKELWNNFLANFKKHLIQKGWFEKTHIAMDERAENVMHQAYDIASKHGFKMALAGNFHASLVDKLQNYCVALHQVNGKMSGSLAKRKANGQISTFYVSCAESEPNIFSNSYPAEATYLPLFAAANNLDGFLHWSWINWDEHPLTDSRFRLFGSGDTYCYYPGNRSSVRFERLIEGIHQYEKIQILRKEFQNNPTQLNKLETLLSFFQSPSILGKDCGNLVDLLEDFLNGKEVKIPTSQVLQEGYYQLVCKDINREPYLYNNALHPANHLNITFQNKTPITTNTGLWKITPQSPHTFSIINGDGLPLTAGNSYNESIAGTFTQLTIAHKEFSNNHTYYFFQEALNCSNGGRAFKIGNNSFVTTWSSGGSQAKDNNWELIPVNVNPQNVYQVIIESNPKVYVLFDDGQKKEYAFNNGFFISEKITKKHLSVGIKEGIVLDYELSVKNNIIKVSNIKLLPPPQRTTLFDTHNSQGTYPYRIPAIAKTNTGRLIATMARLVCGTDPGYGQVDLVYKTSDDNGKSWSEMKDIAVGTGKTSETENFFDTAFGDPAIVADRTSNEITMIAVAGCTVYGLASTTRKNPNKIALIQSKDNGNTWQKPIDITEQIYGLFDDGNPINAAFVGAGKIFQSRIIKKNKYYRIYAALCARPKGNRVIFSDDFGKTWQPLGGGYALPAPQGDEPKCEELPDGRVILSSRTSGGRYYNIFTYTDALKANGNWEKPIKCTFKGSNYACGTNSTNGEILIVPALRNSDQQEVFLALQSLPTGNARTNVGIFYKELASYEDLINVEHFSLNWDGFSLISSITSAYSSMDLQTDGNIAFFLEENFTSFGKKDNPTHSTNRYPTTTHNNDGYDGVYLPLSLTYITQNKYKYHPQLNKKAFLTKYFKELIKTKTFTDQQKEVFNQLLKNMNTDPTIEQIEQFYHLFNNGHLSTISTPIKNIDTPKNYNLLGQEIIQPQKGINIINHKKVLK